MSIVNNPADDSTWTDDYRAGWSDGYGHGVHEGLCRLERAPRKLMTEFLDWLTVRYPGMISRQEMPSGRIALGPGFRYSEDLVNDFLETRIST
jgi:hypothetical protein